MRPLAILPLAVLLLTSGCAYDYAGGYAPDHSSVFDGGQPMGWGNGPLDHGEGRFGGRNVADIAVFDAPLAGYGQWVNSRFGRAFHPDVGRDWRPYVNGRWSDNRLWISDDPWGWATDHYGRWGFDDRVGWVWAPGTEWAPSWAAWREDQQQNVAGWAPIPPGVNYSINLGFGSGWGFDNFNSWYAPSWVWVPRSFLYQPGFGGRVLPWRNGANYWGGSHWQNGAGWGNRPGWQSGFGGGFGRGGRRFGNGPGGWQDGGQGGVPGNWQGERQGNWQGDRQGDWRDDRRGDRRGPRGNFGRPGGGPPPGLAPGQVARPDRDGFVGYRTVPGADPAASQAGGAPLVTRAPAQQYTAPGQQYAPPAPQYVEQSTPAPAQAQARIESVRQDYAGRRSSANDEGPTRPD